jgi:hypothetical protein
LAFLCAPSENRLDLLQFRKQFSDATGQAAHANAASVVDRIVGRGSRIADAEFAHPFGSTDGIYNLALPAICLTAVVAGSFMSE